MRMRAWGVVCSGGVKASGGCGDHGDGGYVEKEIRVMFRV